MAQLRAALQASPQPRPVAGRKKASEQSSEWVPGVRGETVKPSPPQGPGHGQFRGQIACLVHEKK